MNVHAKEDVEDVKLSGTAIIRIYYRLKHQIAWDGFLVRLAAHVTNGCKFQIRPSSGKDIAKTKGVLFTAMAVINVRGIWRKVEANLWSDEQKSHEAMIKDKDAKQAEVQ